MFGIPLGMLLALAASAIAANTTYYDFNLTYVTTNPDGLADRHTFGINNQWPLPVIECDLGDTLIVKVTNLLEVQATFHLHGQYQNGTGYQDGTNMVTQCPIAPGSSMTYNLTITEPGTQWYHCHVDYCYPDGYRQAYIVHDPNDPHLDEYDEEILMTMSDWYHTPVEDLNFMSLYNPTGAEPIPDSFLMNDAVDQKFYVKPNTTYRIRIVNIGGFVSQYLWFEGHNFTIIEIDGIPTKGKEGDILYVGAGQRYSILLTTKDTTDTNYAITTVVEWAMLDTIPSTLLLNRTHWLVYNNDSELPKSQVPYETSDDIVPIDDFTIEPYDEMPLLPDPDLELNLTLSFNNLINGENYAMFNDINYVAPKVPTLYTAIGAGNNSLNEKVYGEYTHAIVLEHNQVIQVIVNNDDTGTHLLYLHGHNFQIIARDPTFEDFFKYVDYAEPVFYNPKNVTPFPKHPVRRDVGTVPPQGSVVFRFVADNPGVWIFHCQVDWHLAAGLGLIFVEAPDLIPTRLGDPPEEHYKVCAEAAVPSAGNAAGNTEDYLNLSGAPKGLAWIPDGFTGRGIVAMVFSIISALLGIAALTIYGLADIKNARLNAMNTAALNFALHQVGTESTTK